MNVGKRRALGCAKAWTNTPIDLRYAALSALHSAATTAHLVSRGFVEVTFNNDKCNCLALSTLQSREMSRNLVELYRPDLIG